jgi:hypothetical protein
MSFNNKIAEKLDIFSFVAQELYKSWRNSNKNLMFKFLK